MAELFSNISNVTLPQVVMWLIGGVLIYLAIRKDMEPTLLLPLGFGTILVNLPLSGAVNQIYDGVVESGAVDVLFGAGIANELFPLLLFIGIGAMIDFTPLLANPKLMIFGAAAQFGIFFTMSLAALLGFSLKDAASIGIIGAADGPTSIFVANFFNSKYVGADYGGGLFLHGAGAHRAAAGHQGCSPRKNERRIRMPYSAEERFQAHAHPFPHRDYDDRGHRFPAQRGADRLSDVRQPDPRMRRAGCAVRNGAEGAVEPGHAAAGAHDRHQDAGAVFPDAAKRL